MHSIDFAFLDSGTGGIPYMLDLKAKSKDSRCVYLGDTANFPYGEKTVEEVTNCASEAIAKIIKHWEPKTIVVACNTISVTALDNLRKTYPDLPIVGTVPAIRLAARITKNKRIGLLATNATVNNPYCKDLEKSFASDCEVFSRGDPALVSFVEHDYFTATKEEKLLALKPAIDYFTSKDCDTIILGCTHFTHIAKDMQEAVGSKIKVIDSRDGVSNQALKVEADSDVNASIKELPADMSFFVTALRNKEDEDEYKKLCKNENIPWGGVLD
ncbi:MAG: glutamate racemase [Treponema sp.]|nr:glutamate racemase [Treponema sp.]